MLQDFGVEDIDSYMELRDALCASHCNAKDANILLWRDLAHSQAKRAFLRSSVLAVPRKILLRCHMRDRPVQQTS